MYGRFKTVAASYPGTISKNHFWFYASLLNSMICFRKVKKLYSSYKFQQYSQSPTHYRSHYQIDIYEETYSVQYENSVTRLIVL